MADPVVAMRAVADRLDKAGIVYAFVGGCTVNLQLDNPALTPVRPTDDVDVIVEVVAGRRYSELEEQMRDLGFTHDMTQGAPICRWKLGDLTVDIMPTEGKTIGLNTQWFAEVLATAQERTVRGDVRLRLISPVGFLATKLTAFFDRGDGDYYGSRDIEDFLTVIDGRTAIVAEVETANELLRHYIAASIADLLTIENFRDSLSAALPGDDASQRRLPSLRKKLQDIAALKD
jgi:predicted nucleotidyltransferase